MGVEILLDKNPRGYFYVAGDTISGKVVWQSASAKVVKSASIVCFSREKWDIQNDRYKISGLKWHFNLNSSLIEYPQTIPAGATSFAFSFTLPVNSDIATLGTIRTR